MGGRSIVCWFCGGLFTLIGSIFSVFGVWAFNNMDYVYSHGTGDVAALPYVFTILGACLLVVGCILLALAIRAAGMRKRLLRDGQYIMAEITGVVPNFTVRVNRHPTFKVECSYFDASVGKTRRFYSRNFVRDPSDLLTSRSVRVYLDRANHNYKNYYVDMDAVLADKNIR